MSFYGYGLFRLQGNRFQECFCFWFICVMPSTKGKLKISFLYLITIIIIIMNNVRACVNEWLNILDGGDGDRRRR